jgi:hypothetical protein
MKESVTVCANDGEVAHPIQAGRLIFRKLPVVVDLKRAYPFTRQKLFEIRAARAANAI